MKKRLLRVAVMAAASCGLYAVMLVWMADANVVSSIFSAGSHTPRPLVLGAGAFLFLRVWTALFLPALLAYHLTVALVMKLTDR